MTDLIKCANLPVADWIRNLQQSFTAKKEGFIIPVPVWHLREKENGDCNLKSHSTYLVPTYIVVLNSSSKECWMNKKSKLSKIDFSSSFNPFLSARNVDWWDFRSKAPDRIFVTKNVCWHFLKSIFEVENIFNSVTAVAMKVVAMV